MSDPQVHVVGAGLAGSEAAYLLAESGFQVALHEMRPKKKTAAHETAQAAELVCTNSLKSKDPHSAPGALKAEMRELGSIVLQAADLHQIPGGQALTVDRKKFSTAVTRALTSHPRIHRFSDEVKKPFAGVPTILATGPLTTEALAEWIGHATHEDDLYFYDAIAPIVDGSTIDFERAFWANRYDKGETQDYVNCPLSREEYEEFVDALLVAEKVPAKKFEKEKFYQGCQPIEVIAASGRDSLRFGPMKPVGLTDPRTGKLPHAVLQLRSENLSKTAFNLVGFQTKLKYSAQKAVFQKIPALQRADFLRLGSIHRNTYLNGPKMIQPDLSLRRNPKVYVAGQITGVEGYVESAACGLLAGLFVRRRLLKERHSSPPINTACGALLNHVVASSSKNYQPSGMHFGLFDHTYFTGLEKLPKDQVRKQITLQALDNFRHWLGHDKPKKKTTKLKASLGDLLGGPRVSTS